jgi:thiazole synthase
LNRKIWFQSGNGRSNFSFGKRNGYSSIKRIDLETETDAITSQASSYSLPNTSGARNAKLFFAAQLAREALETNWLKLEIHPDQNT